MADSETRDYFPMPVDRWRTIRLTLDEDAAAALLWALRDYYAERREPSTAALGIEGRLMFEYLRASVDADRAAAQAGGLDLEDPGIVWIRCREDGGAPCLLTS